MRDPRSVAAKGLTLAGYSHEAAERTVQAALDAHARELAEDLRQYAEQQDNEQRHDGVLSAADRIDPEFEEDE